MIKFNNIRLKSYISEEDDMDLFKIKLLRVLHKSDYITCIFILKELKIEYKYIDDNVLNEYSKHLKRYFSDDFINLDEVILKRLVDHLDTSVKLLDFVKVACRLLAGKKVDKLVKEEYFKKIRDMYGYSEIYKWFREMCSQKSTIVFSFEEIYTMMKLVNNEKLSYNNMLPVFKKITKYITCNTIDSNIVDCTKIIQSLSLNCPKFLLKKEEYVHSLLSYLVHIFYEPNNFSFLSLKNAVEILHSIEAISKLNFKSKSIGYRSSGICADNLENLEYIIKSTEIEKVVKGDKMVNFKEDTIISTNIYEEIVALVCTLKLISIFYSLSFRSGSRMFDHYKTFSLVRKISINKLDNMSVKDWNKIYDMFIIYKYELLNTIASYYNSLNRPALENNSFTSLSDDLNFDTHFLYKDLEKSRHSIKHLKDCNEILNMVDFDVLTPLILDNERISYSINIISKYKYPNIILLIHQLYKYHKVEELALLTHNLVTTHTTYRRGKEKNKEYNNLPYIENLTEVLFELYIIDIENVFSPPVKSRRNMILKFYLNNNSDEFILLLCRRIKQMIQNNDLNYNPHFLFFLNFANSDITKEYIKYIIEYTCRVLKSLKEDINSLNTKYNIALLALLHSKIELESIQVKFIGLKSAKEKKKKRKEKSKHKNSNDERVHSIKNSEQEKPKSEDTNTSTIEPSKDKHDNSIVFKESSNPITKDQNKTKTNDCSSTNESRRKDCESIENKNTPTSNTLNRNNTILIHYDDKILFFYYFIVYITTCMVNNEELSNLMYKELSLFLLVAKRREKKTLKSLYLSYLNKRDTEYTTTVKKIEDIYKSIDRTIENVNEENTEDEKSPLDDKDMGILDDTEESKDSLDDFVLGIEEKDSKLEERCINIKEENVEIEET